MKKTLLGFLFLLFSSQALAEKPESLKDMLQEMENVKPTCKRLSEDCTICSDGVKRPPIGTAYGDDVSVDTERKKVLLLGDYDCAANDEAKKAKDGCRMLSDFCRICPNDRYFYKKTDHSIRTDLYECATKPRTYTKR